MCVQDRGPEGVASSEVSQPPLFLQEPPDPGGTQHQRLHLSPTMALQEARSPSAHSSPPGSIHSLTARPRAGGARITWEVQPLASTGPQMALK